MEELYEALKSFNCLDHFSYHEDWLSFEYPGIEVKFTVRKYADLFLVKVGGKEIFHDPEPMAVIEFIMDR